MVIRVYSSFRGKRSNHSRLQKQSTHGALCRLQGQATMQLVEQSPPSFFWVVFFPLNLASDRPIQEKPLKTGTTAQPPTDPKGRII